MAERKMRYMADESATNEETDCTSQTSPRNILYSNYPDSSLSDLFASVSEVNLRLQKVETVNNKLREERKILIQRLSQSEKTSSVYKEEANKFREDLSVVFQENCSLKQENSVLRIRSSNLEKQVAILEEENRKLQSKMLVASTASPSSFSQSLRPEVVKTSVTDEKEIDDVPLRSLNRLENLKVLEKRHSSPQFFLPQNNRESAEEISEKLLAQLMVEKEELESQMASLQRVSHNSSNSSPSSLLTSEFSLLGVECLPEDKELIQQVDVCKHRLSSVKSNLKIMNFTMKYLLYCLSQKRDGSNPELNDVEKTTGVAENESNSPSRTLIDSLEVQPGNPSNPIKQNRSEIRTLNINTNLNVKKILHFPLPQTNPMPKVMLVSRSPVNDSIDVNCISDPRLIERSESSEANMGSPPCSLLTPDSLCSNNVTTPSKEVKHFSPAFQSSSEDRVCPMCQAVFPRLMPQAEFEKHVVDHFDVEEFELI